MVRVKIIYNGFVDFFKARQIIGRVAKTTTALRGGSKIIC